MASSTPRAKSSSTDSDWAKGFLREILTADVDQVPEGFYTARQWAEMWGLSHDCASGHIREAVRKGLMEKKAFRIRCELRPTYPVPHFRAIKGKARSALQSPARPS